MSKFTKNLFNRKIFYSYLNIMAVYENHSLVVASTLSLENIHRLVIYGNVTVKLSSKFVMRIFYHKRPYNAKRIGHRYGYESARE